MHLSTLYRFSATLVIALTTSATAVKSPRIPSYPQRRDYSLWPTVSDPGFYAVSFPPDYHETQILQYNIFPDVAAGSANASLVAKFPAGFAVTQSGPAKIDAYLRPSGAYLGTVGAPLPVGDDGLISEDVYVVLADFPVQSNYAFEFKIDSEVVNAQVQFFEDDDAGFYVRTGTS